MAMTDLKNRKIYVAGSTGLVGSATVRTLESRGYKRILVSSSNATDLREQQAVRQFFSKQRPEVVIVAAARVGGILANDTYRADFIYDNLMIQINLIRAAHEFGVEKLICLGSSCVYPKFAPQPIKEEYLLTGMLEPTNEPYAVSKIAGIKLCESYYRQHGSNFYSVMPTNLFGPHDNFDLETSHVIPAMIRKFHDAKVRNLDAVTLWGSGTPRREFLYVDDLADALLFLMERIDASDLIDDRGISHINIGAGQDISIRELAETIKGVVGFEGRIVFDDSMPDGTPRKLLDVSVLTDLGWRFSIPLEEGLKRGYRWFLDHVADADVVGHEASAGNR